MLKLRQLPLALAIAAFSAAPALAQGTGAITGQVVNRFTREAIGFVTVTAGDAQVISDEAGRYSLGGLAAGIYSVRVTRLGFRVVTDTVTLATGETVTLDVEMAPLPVMLDAVVAIGYGEQEAGDLTGVVENLTPDDFNPGRVISAEQLIEGKVAGVEVYDTGEPGGGVNIRIRGGTSITAANEPLFVVDGMPLAIGGGLSAGRNPLNFLNPDDIASMTVLKDASATAIYGSRGANGVVLIETRGGRAAVGGEGTRLTYQGSVSGSPATGAPEILTADQFRTAVAQYNPAALPMLGSANTNWRDAILRTGIGQEHSMSFAGAAGDFDYRFSAGYLSQEGVVRNSKTERATVGLNFTQRLLEDQIRISANLRGARLDDQFSAGGAIGLATIMAPTEEIMDPNSVNGGYFEWTSQALAANNPVAEVDLTQDFGRTYRSVGDISAEIDVPGVDGLRTTVRFGYDATRAERKLFRPSFLRGEAESGNPGVVSRSNNSQQLLLFDAYANYNRSFDGVLSELGLTAGYGYETQRSEFPYFEARGLSFDLLGTSGVPASAFQRTSIFVNESKLISFFGRTELTLADNYLFTFSVRRDGSSRFGPDNQWGVFPSAAFAWRLSDESFLEDGFFSELKFRASWGVNGNQGIGDYLQYPTYAIGESTARYQFGNEFVTTIRPGAADRNIKWEETESYNFGIDFGFADNRIAGSVDYYNKETTDLLFNVPVAAGTFTSNFITTNIGSLENRGWEFALSALLFDGYGGGFSWTADFNAARNSNEILQINPFGGGEVIPTGGIAGGVGNFIQVLQAGQPNNTFFVFQHIRDAAGMPIWEDVNGDGTIDENDIYVDTDGNGIVNLDDRVPFESPAATWSFGHTSRMTLGPLDASFTLRGSIGNYVYNNVASNFGHYRALTFSGVPNNLHASVLETGFEREQYFSDYYVEDASYLRMDNLSLGWTIESLDVRVFGVVQNVFTITGYSGVDPTAGVAGIDNNLYPRSRTFTGGASVRF